MRLIPFIAFCLLTFALAFALIHKQAEKPLGAISNELMPALSVVTLEGGKPWNAKQLEGQVTLINFFASWCMPCAAEMPELLALKKRFPTLKLEGVVWNDQPGEMKKFLKRYGNPFTGLWLDEGGSAGIALGIRGIPETFIVDSKGIIRFRLGAPITPDMRDGELALLIEKLIAEADRAK